MIQERAISALYQRVGWKQPTIDDYDIVDANNRVSNGGKYFDDFSALVSVRNYKDTQEDERINEADFNKLLKSLQEKAIRFVLEAVFTKKVYENRTLLSSDSGNTDLYALQADNFYGIEIILNKQRSTALDLKQVGFFFNDVNAAFKLHLFHTSKLAPLQSWDVTTEDRTEVFTDIDETIYAFSQSIKGGKYYLGFRSEDVVGSPINRQERVGRSCFVDLSFIRVPMTSLEMFDTDLVVHTSEEYFNIDYSVEEDFTELIISNKASFDHAIGLQHAIFCLEQMANTTRSNVTERNVNALRLESHLELHGNEINENLPYKVGLASKLAKELSRVKRQFNPACRAMTGTLTV